MGREILKIGNVLNNLVHPLNRMMYELYSSLSTGGSFMGKAEPSDPDQSPTGSVFWIGGPGTYTNYGGVVIPADYVGFITYNGSAYDVVLIDVSNENKADKSNVLELDNTTPFTPNADYEPATKKYVDDNAGAGDHGGLAGLSDDDHPQYHNNARGDARYPLKNNVLEKDNVSPYEPSDNYHPVTIKKLTEEINAVQAGNLFVGYFATQTELNIATYTYADVNVFVFGTPVMRGTHNDTTLYMPGSLVLHSGQYYVLTTPTYQFGTFNSSHWINIISGETMYYNGRIFLFDGSVIEEKPYTKNGSYAIVEQTDTVWVYDADTGTWSDSGDSSQVESVNGKTGTVVLNTDDIAEGSLNKYISITHYNYISQLFNSLVYDTGDLYVSGSDLHITAGHSLVISGRLKDANGDTFPLVADLISAADLPDQLTDLDTTVTGAQLNALKLKVDNIQSGATVDQSAAEVPYNNIVSGLSAINVQAAIDELNTYIDAIPAGHDPVSVADSTEIDFSLNGQQISASLKSGSIDVLKLDSGVQTSLALANSALQSSDLSGYVQASNLLNEIRSIDGSGSGIDADTLDGIDGSDYATLVGSEDFSGIKTFHQTIFASSPYPIIFNYSNNTYPAWRIRKSTNNLVFNPEATVGDQDWDVSKQVEFLNTGGIEIGGETVWHDGNVESKLPYILQTQAYNPLYAVSAFKSNYYEETETKGTGWVKGVIKLDVFDYSIRNGYTMNLNSPYNDATFNAVCDQWTASGETYHYIEYVIGLDCYTSGNESNFFDLTFYRFDYGIKVHHSGDPDSSGSCVLFELTSAASAQGHTIQFDANFDETHILFKCQFIPGIKRWFIRSYNNF